MIRRMLGVFCLITSAALMLGAVSTSHFSRVPAKNHDQPNPVAGRPDSVAAGAILYREHCEQCHKADARGDGHKKPSLRTDHIRSATDGDLEWFLRQGDLAHGMPSWSSLPEAQRWQLVTYLRSIQ